jgi:hypothetical protein
MAYDCIHSTGVKAVLADTIYGAPAKPKLYVVFTKIKANFTAKSLKFLINSAERKSRE